MFENFFYLQSKSELIKSACAMLFVILALPVFSQSGSKTTLTVQEVNMESSSQVKSLKINEENGKSFLLTYDELKVFFENATIESLLIPVGTQLIMGNDGEGVYYKLTNGKLLFQFMVEKKKYSIGVGIGTKFVVQKTNTDKYILEPKETVKLSPPPKKK